MTFRLKAHLVVITVSVGLWTGLLAFGALIHEKLSNSSIDEGMITSSVDKD